MARDGAYLRCHQRLGDGLSPIQPAPGRWDPFAGEHVAVGDLLQAKAGKHGSEPLGLEVLDSKALSI